MENRTAKSIRNSSVALIGQILSILMSFITRTIFLRVLGAEFLGVNGLFTNVLYILSFAELGIGTAIIYALYKPIAEYDYKKISALMNLYEKAYKLIALFIGIVGLVLVPFLDVFIKEQPTVSHLQFIYVLFLTNSMISYLFAYKRSIIIASQNSYVNSLNNILFLFIQNLLQIAVLLIFGNYVLYLIVQLVSTFLSNLTVSRKADKLFPYLKENKDESVDIETKKKLKKNVMAMISHKIGSVIVSGTDNLLISAFVGVYWVGLYSNYVLIVATLKAIITQVMDAITASVGNLTVTESSNKSYQVFNRIFFVNYLIAGFCSIALYNLMNPFINLWIGPNYQLKDIVVVLIILNFYIIVMRKTAIIYINTYGLFWEIKWKSLVEAFIHLFVSLILLQYFKLGVMGVLLGTTISNVLTNLWWEPYVVYEIKFHISIVRYFIKYLMYTFVALLALLITSSANSFVNGNPLIGFIESMAITTIIPISIFIIAFYRFDEFKYFVNLCKRYLLKE